MAFDVKCRSNDEMAIGEAFDFITLNARRLSAIDAFVDSHTLPLLMRCATLPLALALPVATLMLSDIYTGPFPQEEPHFEDSDVIDDAAIMPSPRLVARQPQRPSNTIRPNKLRRANDHYAYLLLYRHAGRNKKSRSKPRPKSRHMPQAI